MRRLAVRILIGLLTFFVGVFAFALSDRPGFRNCVVEFSEKCRTAVAEDEIAESVFGYHIQQLLPDVESPVYFLSSKHDSDPSEDILMRLQREGLPVRRLSQLGMGRAFSFDCYYCTNGPSEFILRLGRIRWLNSQEVLVGSSCRRWSLNADRAYLFRVVLEGNRWVVKDFELL